MCTCVIGVRESEREGVCGSNITQLNPGCAVFIVHKYFEKRKFGPFFVFSNSN